MLQKVTFHNFFLYFVHICPYKVNVLFKRMKVQNTSHNLTLTYKLMN